MRETPVGMKRLVLLLCALLLAAAPAMAAPPVDAVAQVTAGVTQVQWTPTADFAGLRLTVSGPQGTKQWSFGPGESPIFDLAGLSAGIDGLYTWELRATPQVSTETRRALASLRAAGSDDGLGRVRPAGLPDESSLVQNGSFRVVDGGILQDAAEEPSAGLSLDVPGGANTATAPLQRATAADQVIADDLIVQGSICAGFDCVNGENFGADTLRLKENNLRIHFDDTSNSASFPNNDWRLVANDQSNGGRNIFILQDASAGRDVFAVEAGARSNSLYVESDGDVGMGTANPVVNLHIVDGNTPTVRLDQDGSSGFTPQVWDMAANETNFFIRDATNGSKLPFRIQPNAPGNSIYIGVNGIGFGTASPSALLNVKSTASTSQLLIQNQNGTETQRTLLRLENNGVSDFAIQDTSADGSEWSFQAEGPSFRINKAGTGGDEMVVRDRNDGAGQATLVVNGSIQATNVTFSSSRTLKSGFEPIDTTDVLDRLAALPMTEWTFNSEVNGRRHIGPIAEDFNAAFNLGNSPRSISVIDANGITMAAVQGLYTKVKQRDEEIAELRQQVEQLQQLVEQLATPVQ